MSTNPYAPPTAPVADIPESVAPAIQPIFFPVSPAKLAVLTTCTLGLYQIYWFYKHWQCIKEGQRFDCNPALRSIFSVIFCYPLFHKMRASGVKLGADSSLLAGPLATGWIVTTLTSRLPDPYWLITFISVAFLLPVQAYANRVNQAMTPGHDPNTRFSGWNWAAVAVGGVFLSLIVIGLFMPEP
jgi:hypothetical protein